jgi:tetratricopeptide (TPR) repeat protein
MGAEIPGARDSLLAAVRARVQWFGEFQDEGAVLDQGALAEVAGLLAAVPDLGTDPEAAIVAGWLHWCRYLVLNPGDDEQDLRAALGLFGLAFQALPEAIPDPARHLLEASAVEPARQRDARALAARGFGLFQEALGDGDRAKLDHAISMLRQAVDASPEGDASRPSMLSIIGAALKHRFDRAGDPSDAEEAVAFTGQAVRTCPAGHPGRAEMLSNFAIALLARAETERGKPGDLDQAVASLREAVQATPPGEEDRPGLLTNLSSALSARAERTGAPADMDEAIIATREAISAMPAADPNRAGTLANLGVALRTRFERTGRPADLEEAIGVLRKLAADTRVGHPGRGRILSNLGLSLRDRFELGGRQTDLDGAITAVREAVAITPADHPDWSTWLANLALTLGERFGRTGALADLDEAINVTRQAIEATPADHPNRGRWLANLCSELARRSEHTGALADLDGAIAAARQAVAATAAGHPDRAGMLSSLGAALARRSERTGSPADLDEAITVGRQACEAIPAGHPMSPALLANLGTAFARRSELTGGTADLDEAITAFRSAVESTPVGHIDRAMWQSNLCLALASRSGRARSLADLDEAIAIGRQACEATPTDHPDQAEWLANLAAALLRRFERTESPPDLQEAVTAGQKAAAIDVASPRVRTRAARQWGFAAGLGQRWEEAVAGFETAVKLAGRVAPRSLARRDQEHLLQDIGGLASDAAACCLRIGRKDLAVELFEQGRGILLGQVLDARTDLTELARAHPDLARRFASLRDSLDAAGNRGWRLTGPPGGSGLAADSDAELARLELERRRGLAEEFDAAIEQIRARPEFAGFLRPPPVSDLVAAAAEGPVVIVNVSRFGSHALILTSGGVLEPVRLDDLTPDRVAAQVTGFLAAVGSTLATQTAEQSLTGVLGWLWDAIAGPVLDQLAITGPPQAGQPWPRLWWCVPGLLSFLPLHAAGHHQTRCDANPATVADRVVSSYTPTTRALAHARRARPPAVGHGPDRAAAMDQLVIVAMPETPGASDIPGARAEADLLRQRFPGRTSTLTGAQATRDAVLSALPEAAWAHFACHGHCDPVSPSASRLLLHDHQQHPLTVIDVTQLRQERAALAFLSACSTARPGDRLADEAIHLASAFQLAGYRHVIGTLWPISDYHAIHLADDLYAELASIGSAATAASALHKVTRRLRNRRHQTPSIWASHIHAGA